MSNQDWNSGQGGNPQGGYPQGSQPGSPQGGQPGYPQGGQPGYPQGGQPGYPQGGQPGYPQGGQPGYPQGGQPGYPQGGPQPAPGGSRGGGAKLPLIIAGVIVLIGIIGVVIFLLTNGGNAPAPVPASPSASVQPTEPSPEPTPQEPSESPTAPTPTSPGETPSSGPSGGTLTEADLPETIGDWKRQSLGEVGFYYAKDLTTVVAIVEMDMGIDLPLQEWASGIDNPVESANGKVICGTTVDIPACLVETANFGILNAAGSDVDPADLTELADGLAAALN